MVPNSFPKIKISKLSDIDVIVKYFKLHQREYTRKGRFFAERSGRAERLLCTFCYGGNNFVWLILQFPLSGRLSCHTYTQKGRFLLCTFVYKHFFVLSHEIPIFFPSFSCFFALKFVSLPTDKKDNRYDTVSNYVERPVVSAQHPTYREVAGGGGEGHYGKACCQADSS